LLGEIQLADLNILDAIWINANPYSGPGTSYGGATRRDELVASVDPVAADIWATKIILIPAFMANGYYPPWPEPSADPDDATSDFRVYLDNSMGFILTAGYDATNDLRDIDAVTWSGAGDLDGDGFNDTVDNCPYDANPGQADCDDDGTGDLCAIREGLSQDCNANGIPDECEWPTDINADGVVNVLDLIELLLCFGQPADPPCDASDINPDGTVNVLDLIELLLDFGSTCPP
ncbi:MAG: thrombospondin type 3 repeat-containing protein, partial [Planctomycetota bacterium]